MPRQVSVWVRLVFGTLLWVVSLAASVRAATDDYVFFTLGGSFRSASSLSRYERAAALSHYLFDVTHAAAPVSSNDEESLRRQVRQYWPELKALGVEVGGTLQSLPQWSVRMTPPLSALSLDDDTHWALKRMAALDAFWTNPSSQILRKYTVEPLDSPLVVVPRQVALSLLGDWAVEPTRYDFMMRAALPARANKLRMPIPQIGQHVNLPPRVTTLQELALLGLPATPQATTMTPVSMPKPHSVAEISTAALTWTPNVTLNGSYDIGRVEVPIENVPSDFLETPSRSFLSTSGASFTHFGSGLDYDLPFRNLGVNVNLDEWRVNRYGPVAANGLEMHLQDARVNLNYNVNPSFSLQGGYIYSRTSGLYAAGLTNPAADMGTLNLREDRGYPYVGFDYKISNNARWNVNIRFYNTLDIGGGTRPPGLNLADPQVTTEVKVQF